MKPIKKFFRWVVWTVLGLPVLAMLVLLALPFRGDIPVLMYHFAGSPADTETSGNFVTEKGFRRQMQYLKYLGFRVISLEDYAAILSGKRKALGREVVLTFDDGNITYYTHFYPILKEFKFPSAVFMVTESVQYQKNSSMDEQVINDLKSDPLVTFGSHSKTHPNLTELDAIRLRDEVLGSKMDLEEMIGKPVRFFAYPSGVVNDRVLQAVKEAGYELAFTTSPKKLGQVKEGIFSRTRTKMTEEYKNLFMFLGITSGIYQNYKRVRHWMLHG